MANDAQLIVHRYSKYTSILAVFTKVAFSQEITGPALRLHDLAASWPGSAHDSRIFDSSRALVLYKTGSLPVLCFETGYDACQSYLTTPFKNPPRGTPEYRQVHSDQAVLQTSGSGPMKVLHKKCLKCSCSYTNLSVHVTLDHSRKHKIEKLFICPSSGMFCSHF